MSDSTSISNLPSNNVKLTTTETPVQSTTSQSPPLQQQPGNAQASSITELLNFENISNFKFC